MNYLLEREETSRLLFRLIESSDFNSWLPFFEDPESFRHWNTKIESPAIECEQWYEKQFGRYRDNKGGMNALINKATGELIGHCGLLVQTVDGNVELEIGYSLLPSFWNKGFASEAAAKCQDVAFKNDYSPSLISIVSLTNAASARVAEKNGMSISKQTVYYDNPVNIFRITKERWLLKTSRLIEVR